MTRIKFSQHITDQVTAITSPKVEEDLRKTLQIIVSFPEIGSLNVPRSIQRLYSGKVRKISVGPFILVYEYLESCDTVLVYDFIATRAAW